MIKIEKLTLVYINCTIWTATRRIDLTQLNLPALPPELASPGSIKILDPEKLSVFKQIRNRVEGLCKKYGSRFCGNWIIPNEKLSMVTRELERYRKEFAKAKDAFIRQYEKECSSWILQHPEYAGVIKHLQLEQKNISGKFYFDYITYQIGMETLQNLNKALDLVVESEFSQAALDFRSIMIDNLIDADSISKKVADRVERICHRMRDFRNLDPRFDFIPDFYDSASAGLMKEKKISGEDCSKYYDILAVMADTEFIFDLIRNEVTDPDEILRLHQIKANLWIGSNCRDKIDFESVRNERDSVLQDRTDENTRDENLNQGEPVDCIEARVSDGGSPENSDDDSDTVSDDCSEDDYAEEQGSENADFLNSVSEENCQPEKTSSDCEARSSKPDSCRADGEITDPSDPDLKVSADYVIEVEDEKHDELCSDGNLLFDDGSVWF